MSLEASDSQTFPFMDLETPCALELFMLDRDYFAVLCVEDGVHSLKIFRLDASGDALGIKVTASTNQRTYFALVDKIDLQAVEGRVTGL